MKCNALPVLVQEMVFPYMKLKAKDFLALTCMGKGDFLGGDLEDIITHINEGLRIASACPLAQSGSLGHHLKTSISPYKSGLGTP